MRDVDTVKAWPNGENEWTDGLANKHHPPPPPISSARLAFFPHRSIKPWDFLYPKYLTYIHTRVTYTHRNEAIARRAVAGIRADGSCQNTFKFVLVLDELSFFLTFLESASALCHYRSPLWFNG